MRKHEDEQRHNDGTLSLLSLRILFSPMNWRIKDMPELKSSVRPDRTFFVDASLFVQVNYIHSSQRSKRDFNGK
jgi:hypothetical protein